MANVDESNVIVPESKTGMSAEDLSAFVEEKIHESFLAYQTANDIPSGDISPMDALQLERLQGQLVGLVESVCGSGGAIDDDYAPEWDDGSSIGCKDCPADECTGHCMSCAYRPI